MSIESGIKNRIVEGRHRLLFGVMGVLGLALALLAAVGTQPARAGEYTVKLCSAADGSGSGIDRVALNSEVIAYRDLCLSGQGIQKRVIPRNGAVSGKGTSSSVGWVLPPSISVADLRFDGDLKYHKYWVTQMIVSGQGKWKSRPSTNPVPGNRGYSFDRSPAEGLRFEAVPNTGYNRVTMKQFCNPVRNEDYWCSRSGVDARAKVRNIAMDLHDSEPPRIRLREDGDQQDPPFPELDYGQGIDAQLDYWDDGSGAKQRKILVNGKQLSDGRSFLDFDCSVSRIDPSIATRISPCPRNPVAEREDHVDLPTGNERVFHVGVNTIEIWVTDYSGEVGYTKRELVVRPIPVAVDQPDQAFGPGDVPVVEGEVGGSAGNSSGSGPIEAFDADSGEWKRVGSFTSAWNGSFKTKLRGLGKVTPSKVVKTKVKKAGKPKRGKLSTYRIRARVTNAPRARAGATSKMKVVKVKSVR